MVTMTKTTTTPSICAHNTDNSPADMKYSSIRVAPKKKIIEFNPHWNVGNRKRQPATTKENIREIEKKKREFTECVCVLVCACAVSTTFARFQAPKRVE